MSFPHIFCGRSGFLLLLHCSSLLHIPFVYRISPTYTTRTPLPPSIRPTDSRSCIRFCTFSPALEYVLGDGVDSTAQKALFSFPLIQAAIGGDRGREGCRVEGWVVVTLYLAGEGTPPHPHPVLPILHPTHYSSSCAVGSVGAVVGIRGKEKEKNGEVAKPSFPSLSSFRPERRFSGFWADGGGGGGGAPKRCMRRRP